MIREEEDRIKQKVGGSKMEKLQKSIPVRIPFLTLNQDKSPGCCPETILGLI